ncbi:hypothetical protein BH20PSE1_BH20PSE1_01480 [soil metagenome]
MTPDTGFKLLFHPHVRLLDASRLARATGRVLAQDGRGGVVLKVRCATCRHHQPEHDDIGIGWCAVQHQYRALRFLRTCEDWSGGLWND